MSGRSERPWSPKLPPHVRGRGRAEDGSGGEPWDTVVVGSGMGGMTAAALLAKLGQRVLVLEQHYVPGGFTQTFKRPGYVWDVGVHAVGEMSRRSALGRVLDSLAGGRLQWQTIPGVYDRFDYPDGFGVGFPDSPQAFRNELAGLFPRSVGQLDAYLSRVRDVAKAMRWYFARALPRPLGTVAGALHEWTGGRGFRQTAHEVMRSLVPDERLRTVLCAQWGYHGTPVREASFAIQALITRHFAWGAYYPVGGSGRIAHELLETVARSGGWTRIRADVAEIEVEGGRAVGVRMSDGARIRARTVISAAGVQSTVRRLLPATERSRPWARSIDALSPGPAHVCLYIGWKGDAQALGASATNRWFYETWSLDDTSWHVTPERVRPDAPVLYCSFPSLKDPLHDPGPEQRHTAEVVTFVPWQVFEPWQGLRWHHRGADYEAFKAKLQDALLRQFLRHMPQLEGAIDHVELSTPVSTDHFTRPIDGSIYGLSCTPERFSHPHLVPRAPIRDLYFAGSEVATCGVAGAMLGGVMAGLAISPLRTLDLLRRSSARAG